MRSLFTILFYGLPVLGLLLLVLRFTLYRDRRLNPWIFTVLILSGLITLLYFFYPLPDQKGRDQQQGSVVPVPVRPGDRLYLSLDSLLDAYFLLVDDAAADIPANMEQSGRLMLDKITSLDIEELLQDTLLYDSVDRSLGNIESELAAIIADPGLAEKKASLNILSGEFRGILQATRYKRRPLYWMQSAAAFGPDHPGYWLSPDPRQKKSPYGQPDHNVIEIINGEGNRFSTNTK